MYPVSETCIQDPKRVIHLTPRSYYEEEGQLTSSVYKDPVAISHDLADVTIVLIESGTCTLWMNYCGQWLICCPIK